MKQSLWYKTWANCWDEALPLGNGRIGGMVYSQPYTGRIQINEETLWSGAPTQQRLVYPMEKINAIRTQIDQGAYKQANEAITQMLKDEYSQAYMTFGALYYEINNPPMGAPSGYTRRLDLSQAVLRSDYTINNVTYDRECFVSNRDDVLVVRVHSSHDWMDLSIRLCCDLEHQISAAGDSILIQGRCPTDVGNIDGRFVRCQRVTYDPDQESVEFAAGLKVRSDGLVTAQGATIRVEQSSWVEMIFSIGTSFNGFDKMPKSQGRDAEKICREKLEAVWGYTYEALKIRHIAAYQTLFDRSALEIDGESFDHLPTDERIRRVANGGTDNGLVTLLFDYARYLLISCSRAGGQPANLQGIWTKEVAPPWRANYTMNINAQMNYWMAEQTNLADCHMPFIEMIRELSTRGNHYGLSGWVCCHNTDLWRFNHEATRGVFAFWQWGGIWGCLHIFEHYAYTQDRAFLAEYMPVLQGAMDFLADWVVRDEDGKYTTSPSTSPENYFLYAGEHCAAAKGSAMDLSIIRTFLTHYIEACGILDIDCRKSREILENLAPLQIGEDGRLLEWNEPFVETEPGHRHASHLFGVYPGDTVTADTPYFAAAQKSLAVRMENGSGQTGWSNAWTANYYARFRDGEKALYYIKNMFKKSMYPNMFDAHPPFQIDGNFGIAAAICEMLIQSHGGKLELLPALPAEWGSGRLRGFKARGGRTIDMAWADGKLTAYRITGPDGREETNVSV